MPILPRADCVKYNLFVRKFGLKDKAVPKGWITYQHETLRICTGKSNSPKCNAPPGTACHGENQHEPVDGSGVLFTVSARVESLHDLFCVAEGLLQTL
jgi:hypothetical protein